MTKTILEVKQMIYWGDEIDWLTGKYTDKKERLLREVNRPGNRDDIMEV